MFLTSTIILVLITQIAAKPNAHTLSANVKTAISKANLGPMSKTPLPTDVNSYSASAYMPLFNDSAIMYKSIENFIVKNGNSMIVNKSDVDSKTLCLLAPNCKMELNSKGFMQATIDRNYKINSTISKRDSSGIVGMVVGNHGADWGTTNPSDTINNAMYNRCGEYGCSTDTWQQYTVYNDNGYEAERTVDIQPGGFCSTWDQRNMLVEALKAAVQTGQSWYQENVKYKCGNSFRNGDLQESCSNKNIWTCYQSDYYQATLYQYKGGPVLAQMQYYAKSMKPESGFDCGAVLGSVTGALGFLPGSFGQIVGFVAQALCS